MLKNTSQEQRVKAKKYPSHLKQSNKIIIFGVVFPFVATLIFLFCVTWILSSPKHIIDDNIFNITHKYFSNEELEEFSVFVSDISKLYRTIFSSLIIFSLIAFVFIYGSFLLFSRFGSKLFL